MTSRKKLGVVVGGVAVVGAAVALTAGTFSYFSDSQSSSAATAKTGTLTLHLGMDQNGTAGHIKADNIAPGWSDTETFTISNTGSLDGEVWVTLKDTANSDAVLESAMTLNALNASMPVSQALSYTKSGVDLGKLAAGTTKTYTITFDLPSTTGNEVQGKQLGMSIQADLEQIDNAAPHNGPLSN
jgi:spore coat-associated protein N